VHYFPAFDIVNSEFSHQKYWSEDGRHLRSSTALAVISRFADAFCSEKTKKIMTLSSKLEVTKNLESRLSILSKLEELGFPQGIIRSDKAKFYSDAKMYKKAFEALCKLELAEKTPVVQHQLGWLLLQMGERTKALEHFKKTIELLEDINGIAFSGAKRDDHILYGTNHLRPGTNFSELRTGHMKKLKKIAEKDIQEIEK